jgi:hypothetical protein
MLRFLGFATLVLIAVCLAVSASIALADDGAAPAATAVRDRTVEAIDPDRRMIDGSLATIEAVHAFDGPSVILGI